MRSGSGRCYGFRHEDGKRVLCTERASDSKAKNIDGWWHPIDGEMPRITLPQHTNGDGPRVVYAYCDEDGNVLFEKVRDYPKRFWSRRPDGTRGIGDARKVPYHLRDLIGAVARGALVNVVDGEKDVEAIERAGGVATCGPDGAGNWTDEYSRYLTGAHVFVHADRDGGKGLDQARRIRRSLAKYAASVTIVEALFGKDAYDHLAAGFTLDEFVEVRSNLADLGRLRLLTLTDAFELAEQPVDWVVTDLLAAGEKAVIAGPPKSLKTWLALHLVRCVAAAEPVLEREAWSVGAQQAVLFVQEEGSAQRWAQRLAAVFEGVEDAPFAYTHRSGFSLMNEDHVAWVVEQATAMHARLVVIDPWQRVTAGVRERDEQETAPAWDAIHEIARETGAAVLVLHHSKKGSDLDLEAIRGSSRMAGEVDLAMVLRKNENAEIEVYLDGRDLVRGDDEAGNLIVTYDRDRPHAMRSSEFRLTVKAGDRTKAAIVDFLWAHDFALTSAIHEAVEKAIGSSRKRETILKHLRYYEQEGFVASTDDGDGREKAWKWIGETA